MSKSTGIKAFCSSGMKVDATASESDFALAETKKALPRTRGRNEFVALTVRLRHDDWRRLHEVGMARGVSLQSLCTEGLSLLLDEMGLPPISTS